MNEGLFVGVKSDDGSNFTKSSVDISDKKYPVPILGKRGDKRLKRLILNPDIDKVMEVVNKIKENKGLCPSKSDCKYDDCRTLKPDTRCPCPDLIIYGKCECGLFVETDLVPIIKEENNG